MTQPFDARLANSGPFLPPTPPPTPPTQLQGSCLVWNPSPEAEESPGATDWEILSFDGEPPFELSQVGDLWSLEGGELIYHGPERTFWAQARASVRVNNGVIDFGVDGSGATPFGGVLICLEDDVPIDADPSPFMAALTPPANVLLSEGASLGVDEESTWDVLAQNLVTLTDGDRLVVAYGSLVEAPQMVVRNVIVSLWPADGAEQFISP